MNSYKTIILCLLLLSKADYSQKPDIIPVVTHTSHGAQIDFSNGNHSFFIRIKGRKVQPYKSAGVQNYLMVDGNLLQYLTVPFQEKVDYSGFDLKQKQDFLTDYESYEMSYIANTLSKS